VAHGACVRPDRNPRGGCASPAPVGVRLTPYAFAASGAILAFGMGAVAPAQDRPRFKAESELVVLHVMVTDRRGAYVTGLTADAFRVFEDDRPQTIRFLAAEDTPVTVGLILDSSGSMLPLRDRVIAASAAFIETSNSEDDVFALVFDDDVRPVLASTSPFTSDPRVLRDALTRAFVPSGRTALYDAIANGLAYVANGSRDRHVLVVLSDGGDNASQLTFADVLTQVQASNTAVFTVALVDPLDREANPRRLKAFADASGGEAFSPHAAAGVDRDFRQIARDVRHSYTIGYEPSERPRNPAFRRIRLEVRSPDGRRLVTHTRTGYLAERAAGGIRAR
jgi:Ca-activated chloride channel homolog